MKLSVATAFCCCLILTSVARSTGLAVLDTNEACRESCEALADRVTALEAKWAKLSSLFSDESCPDKNPDPEPEYRCYKGMASPTTPARVPVKILGGSRETLCDTETDGGGWIVIQRRADGVEDFYRDWETYKSGFGTLNGDYWLGNDAIHSLTSSGTHELRIDMKYDGIMYYARYSSFVVQDESLAYKMTLGTYSGNSGDSFTYHNNMKFSTFDRDNDIFGNACAVLNHGGWWFKSCNYCDLNGKWGPNAEAIGGYLLATRWNFDLTSRDGPYLSFTEMKIRRI